MAYKKEKKKEEVLVLRNDVYQSNPLVQARKKFDILGMKVFILGLCGLNPHFSKKDKYFDADFREMFIPTSKLTELFGNTWYLGELKLACNRLFNAIVEFNYDDGGFTLYHLFRRLDYVPKEGLYLRFEEELRPYILDLFQSKGYTKINVEYIFKLSSPYAVRLLELLLQYQNIKQFKEQMEIKRKMTVEEVRFALNVPEGAYNERMDNFRRFVLDDPIREINTRTPYIIRYETTKEGRKVVAFEFIMETYNIPKDDRNDYKLSGSNEAIRSLCALGFAEKDARAIFAKCQDVPDCFSRINRAQAILARNKKPIVNKLGFLREAIEKDWQVGCKANTESTRRRKVTKEKDVLENVSHSNSSMASIGQILKSTFSELVPNLLEDKPPARPKSIKIGRREMPYGLAETFIGYIRKGEYLESMEECLKNYKTTIEKFTKICEKNGL